MTGSRYPEKEKAENMKSLVADTWNYYKGSFRIFILQIMKFVFVSETNPFTTYQIWKLPTGQGTQHSSNCQQGPKKGILQSQELKIKECLIYIFKPKTEFCNRKEVAIYGFIPCGFGFIVVLLGISGSLCFFFYHLDKSI